MSEKFITSSLPIKLVIVLFQPSPSLEKQFILSRLFCFSKKNTDNFGGLLLDSKNLSFNVIKLYSSGFNLIRNSNLSKSPYFSLIGNLGNSYLSLFTSITPEC